MHGENVVLDIGGDQGSLIIYTHPDRDGVEIELSEAGHDGDRVHAQVHQRRLPGGALFAAVFPGLRAGDYRVWAGPSGAPDRVTVQAGQVAELDWRR